MKSFNYEIEWICFDDIIGETFFDQNFGLLTLLETYKHNLDKIVITELIYSFKGSTVPQFKVRVFNDENHYFVAKLTEK